jgi:DNA-binding HxlR family transcriptional regulator
MARALETVGDRWALLVVRDLMHGPRRFSDLLDTCGGITPKQLTTQLGQLRDAGVVHRDQQEGRREVWYSLSPSGRELAPVVDHLLLWGFRHAVEPPRRGERLDPLHLLNGTRVALQHADRVPPAPVVWVWRMDEQALTLRYDGRTWTLTEDGDPAADVVVDTTAAAWAEFVTASRDRRHLGDAVALQGAPEALATFSACFAAG